MALAFEETARFAPYEVATRAEPNKGGKSYRITGTKTFVLDGHVASQLIVVGAHVGQ